MKSSPTQHIYNKVYRAVLMSLCMVSLFSCVKVDLCRESNHTHTGDVKIYYHWPKDISEGQRPDSMLALVNRVINSHRIGYVTDSESSVGGRYRFGKVYDDATIETTPDDQQPLKVGAGEYQVFAFNNDIVDVNSGSGVNDVVDYRFDSLNEFIDNIGTMSICDLGIAYVGRERTDSRLSLYGKDWMDFNPYSKYIATDIKPIFRAFNERNEDTQEYTFTVNIDGESEVHLYPEKMTQDITLSFPIYADEGVVIDSVIAEVSGIPHKMLIYTGSLVVDSTYKMLFKMDIDTDNSERVSLKIKEESGMVDKNFTKIECEHTISVMGLIANSDSTSYTGAGILQLCIYLHAIDDDGVKKSKNQYAKINMFRTIRDANLVITDNLGNAIQNPGTYENLPCSNVLRIDGSYLIVTRDLILKTSNDGNSVDSWVGDSDGDGKVDDEDHKLDVEI